MTATVQHKLMAQKIDQWVKNVERKGGGDEQLLKGMADYMGTFKKVLDTTTQAQREELCSLYPGFLRFANLLERLAQGIHDGVIVPPKS